MSDPDPAAGVALGAGREFDAIRELLETWGPRARGIGDDAAVLDLPTGERLVVSTDAAVEGVHFRREWLTPREIGARAAAAALSDLAAMAASPIGLLLALAVPDAWRGSLAELARGVGDVAARAGCPIVGGNLTRAGELSLTTTVLGAVRSPLARRGVRAGDTLWVTGTLGGPRAALEAWRAGREPAPAHRARFAAPAPRIAEARWLAERGALAAIDLSDGLAADAGHLAAASGVRVTLALDAIPCVDDVAPELAAASGEEYELLVAFGAGAPPDARAFRERFAIPLTCVGRATAGRDVIAERGGTRVDLPPGHDHLS